MDTLLINRKVFTREKLLARQGSSSQKLKFSEWRPIGVCDIAPPGVQKAQMFTREDFLIVTAPDINRDNWQNSPEVMSVLQRYCKKLARQSTTTRNMIHPSVSSIKLVGAVMKLVVTPVLNKESKDGKLQLFQIEFKDTGVKKKTPWKLILGVLLSLLVLLCIGLGIALYQKFQAKPYTARQFKPTPYTTPYCENPLDKARYDRQLEEVAGILQQKTDQLQRQGWLSVEANCAGEHLQQSMREERFLNCYALIKRHGMLPKIPRADLTKVNACRQAVCTRRKGSKSDACL